MKRMTLAVALAALGYVGRVSAADVVIVQGGEARAVIVADGAVMAPDRTDVPRQTPAEEQERDRRRLRESVNDLALYLGKISGAQVEILTNSPAPGDRRLPILVGAPGERAFGRPRARALLGQGFRVVVSPKGIGLVGESDLSTSYAIYEVLDRLGCRWYMPSDLGEVVPKSATVALPAMDYSGTPGTLYRGIWYADDAFKRRNRMGGLLLSAGHSLEISNHITKEQFAAHPDWQGLVDGKRTTHRFCWASMEAADAVADSIVAGLDKQDAPTISLSPDDGASFCECEKCKALDTGDMDPTMGQVSITDRYLHFCNRIAERVTKKYPDVLFGFLAYVQYTRPPLREKVHPNLVPQIAPITYCRAHSMLSTNCPSRPLVRAIAEGWGKKARHVSYYNYMFHLAEVAVPYPMMRQMSDELPLLYASKVDLWQPETMPNFESVLPGMWLSIRMAWDPGQKPAAVLDEFFARFYGAAAAPMRAYWTLFDDAWMDVPEHAGCGFGYGRRFTPEFMKAARAAMDAALAACATDAERGRVKMQDEALKQFELFMKLRRDLFEGRFAELDKGAAAWTKRQLELGSEYAAQYAFSKVGWTPHTIGGAYFKSFFEPEYVDAARIAREGELLGPTVRAWRYAVDREKKGESLGWQKAEFADAAWPVTDPCVDTWYAMGLDSYYGAVFYRASVPVPAVPAGKKVFLWISSTDGKAKVFVNGTHVPYVNAKGESSDEFSGYCSPASFDITAAVKPGADNQITIVGTRVFINELGTGGLIGPVVLYREK